MRLPLTAAALALGLAACAPGLAPPEPRSALLSDEVLRLEMSDGRVCRLARAEAAFDGLEGWGGPVAGCPGVARAEVALERIPPGAPRALIGGLFAALTLDGLLSPIAEVRVVSETGRVFLFASPPPVQE